MARRAAQHRRHAWAFAPLPLAATALLALAALAGALLSPRTAIRLAASPAGCSVAYSVPSSWPGGFTGSVTITNTGPAITSWTLAFTFPGDQQVSSGWSGTWSSPART
ncbi:MAG TPA: cellulose binding domain-containing protein [Streptosporangiaceae bacterium]|jgi:cellulase/cellobiase CelA1